LSQTISVERGLLTTNAWRCFLKIQLGLPQGIAILSPTKGKLIDHLPPHELGIHLVGSGKKSFVSAT